MPSFDLTDDEHAALAAYLRRQLDAERYPFAPGLRPVKSALEKLDPRLPS